MLGLTLRTVYTSRWWSGEPKEHHQISASSGRNQSDMPGVASLSLRLNRRWYLVKIYRTNSQGLSALFFHLYDYSFSREWRFFHLLRLPTRHVCDV